MLSPPDRPRKKIQAIFYATEAGDEPVREFLLGVEPPEERRFINADIRTAEYGWPIGMPTCRPLGDGIYEVRSSLPNRIARVLFMVNGDRMVLLHGFIKKTQKTPKADLDVARDRKRKYEKGLIDGK